MSNLEVKDNLKYMVKGNIEYKIEHEGMGECKGVGNFEVKGNEYEI